MGAYPISRSPNDADTAGSPSRVTAGPPRAPLRSVRPRPASPDPAETSTLDMLGSNPLAESGGSLFDAPTGGAGFLMGSMAMVAKGVQGLAAGAPGFVPPEILMWLDNAMQALPQLIQQQQSGLSGAVAGTGTPMSPQTAPPMGGPPGMGGPAGGGAAGGGMPM